MKKMRKTVVSVVTVTLLAAACMLNGCGMSDFDISAQGNAQALEEATGEETETDSKEGLDEDAGSSEVIALDEQDLVEPEVAEQTDILDEHEETPSEEEGMQLVFLGDSIFDNARDGTGIPYLTSVMCDADCYNMSMGGTAAALLIDESAVFEKWESRCLMGVVNVICGNVSPEILEGYTAYDVYKSCDFSKTDYFIIEYGMNDYFNKTRLTSDDNPTDLYTYAGALRSAINTLRAQFPDAKIVLCSPNYAQFWAKGAYAGDGNIVSNGVATLVEYYRVCGNVSADYHTLFLNAYEGIGLDAYTAEEYLEDGVHLTEKGRKQYARILAEIINEDAGKVTE